MRAGGTEVMMLTAEVDREVCAGAWRHLCAGVLLQTYVADRGVGGNVKETLYQKRDARQWLEGGVGLITFEDCCEALQVDSERARRMIESHCTSAENKTRRIRR